MVALGSGNLGLIYLMEERRRLTMEEIAARHPRLLPALREHPHIGFLLVRSGEHGAVALGARGANYLSQGRIEGEDPLAPFSANAAAHLLRTDSFEHVADIMVNSFYDPELEEGCAFEELISFHGGMGGPQTQPFILHPVELSVPSAPIVGSGRGARGAHGLASGAAGRPGGGADATTCDSPGVTRPPIPWASATLARSMSIESPNARATVASSRASSSSTAGRWGGRTSSWSSSSIARIRRITWIERAP